MIRSAMSSPHKEKILFTYACDAGGAMRSSAIGDSWTASRTTVAEMTLVFNRAAQPDTVQSLTGCVSK